MERAEILDRLWAKAEPIVYIPKEAFLQGLDGWKITPIELDGVVAFITVQKGPDFHFETMDTGHQITRKMIIDFLTPIIDKYGYAATKTPHEDERQHRFNKILGFEIVGHDNFDIHYRITRVRGVTCQ